MLESLQQLRAILSSRKVFLYTYYLSLALILVGFVYSRALLSIGQIMMAANWLVEGQLDRKMDILKKDKFAFLFAGLYVLHALFLLNTSNFEYALEDLRIKLPLLLFPIVFSSTHFIHGKNIKNLLIAFVMVVLSSTLVIEFNYMLKQASMADIREASFLISHIRLALMICLSLAIIIFYIRHEGLLLRAVLLLTAICFISFMIYFVYFTGLAIMAILFLFVLIWLMLKRGLNRGIMKATLVAIICIPLLFGLYLAHIGSHYYSANHHKENPDMVRSANGRPYTQWYTENKYDIRENGHLVFQNLCLEELEKEWNQRSSQKVHYLDGQYSEIEDILLRYLASKGVPKDSISVSQLTSTEILAIEKGITNINLLDQTKLYKRIYTMMWEYDVYMSDGNFNGHSLGTRLEFWKTGWHVFQGHFWFGTGTGDIEDAFQKQYDLDQSKLSEKWRFRSHNQFISMAATFGIFGFLYFLWVIFSPIPASKSNFLYLCFSIVFIASICTEDTLETQIGVTFYAFFNALLFYGWKDRSALSKAE